MKERSPYNAAEWDLATPAGREALAVAMFKELIPMYAPVYQTKESVANAGIGWDGVQMLANALEATYRRAMEASPDV